MGKGLAQCRHIIGTQHDQLSLVPRCLRILMKYPDGYRDPESLKKKKKVEEEEIS